MKLIIFSPFPVSLPLIAQLERDIAIEGKLKALDSQVLVGEIHATNVSQIKLNEWRQKFRMDFNLLPTHDLPLNLKLCVFDMDSTLIQAEVIDELGRLQGVGDKIAAITQAAMEGKIDFNQALIERVKCLKGLSQEKMASLYPPFPLMKGVEELIKFLKQRKVILAILSGGFNFYTLKLQKILGFDDAYAHDLVWENNQLTGEVEGSIINGEKKKELMLALALKHQISPQQVMAIGDGANDLLMIQASGLGVAVHAKMKLKEQAKIVIDYTDMSFLTYLFHHDL